MSATHTDINLARQAWHPIASLTDLVPRHVFHAQMLGRELAVWQADDGNINVWENRCLHRGVRLSIGVNDGTELVCQYHGWRYANRTAGCTYIPAHPADAPARSICNNTYPVLRQYGLLWSSETPDNEPLSIPELDDASLVLRPFPINAPATIVADSLQHYALEVPGETVKTVQTESRGEMAVICTANDQCIVVFVMQIVDSERTVLRGIVPESACDNDERTLLLAHNSACNRIRTLAEKRATEREPLPPLIAPIKPVAAHLASLPAMNVDPNGARLRVSVNAIDTLAKDVKAFTLLPTESTLPTFHPGAHIDVHLPNGLVRQYSLTNAPGQTDRFIIAVKRDAHSTGGSAHLHDHLKVGDVLATSEPRNNFPLRRDAINTLLIAGGIGITPLMSMAQAMEHAGTPFELHYFVQSDNHVAFRKQVESFGDKVRLYTALSEQQSEAALKALLQHYKPAVHCYLCGPPRMLDAAQRIAAENHWPDSAVHIEYFKNTRERDQQQAFEVSLARSGMTLQVPAGKSLLQTLRENGIPVPSSCEQGACGTCRLVVLSGKPDHQDVYLNPTEKARGDCMMSCVSRALSSSLTLDI